MKISEGEIVYQNDIYCEENNILQILDEECRKGNIIKSLTIDLKKTTKENFECRYFKGLEYLYITDYLSKYYESFKIIELSDRTLKHLHLYHVRTFNDILFHGVSNVTTITIDHSWYDDGDEQVKIGLDIHQFPNLHYLIINDDPYYCCYDTINKDKEIHQAKNSGLFYHMKCNQAKTKALVTFILCCRRLRITKDVQQLFLEWAKRVDWQPFNYYVEKEDKVYFDKWKFEADCSPEIATKIDKYRRKIKKIKK